MKRRGRIAKQTVKTAHNELNAKIQLKWLSVIIGILGLLGIFVLPWFVPYNEPVFSFSYTYGFNNRISILSLGAMLGLLSLVELIRAWKYGLNNHEVFLLEIMPTGRSNQPLLGYGIALLGFIFITCSYQIWWYTVTPCAYYAEMGYFVSLIDMICMGYHPYVDFQYNYGPALLYLPGMLVKFSNGGISVEAAYLTILVATGVVGNILLCYVIRNFSKNRDGLVVYITIAISTLPSLMNFGLNYSPLRFIAPLASLVFLHKLFVANTNSTHIDRIKIIFFGFLLPILNFSISPEIGLSAYLGIIVYFLAVSIKRRREYFLVISPLLTLPLFLVLFSPAYLTTLFSFAGGATNVPVAPTLHIVTLVAAACFIIPNLTVAGLLNKSENAAMTIALTIAMGLLLPAALGRCDVVHVFWNGMGISILLVTLFTRISNVELKWTTFILYLIVFGECSGLTLYNCYRTEINNALAAKNDFKNISDLNKKALQQSVDRFLTEFKCGFHYGKMLLFDDEYRKLLTYKKIGTPLGATEDCDKFLKLSGRYVVEYHASRYMQISNNQHIMRKLADLRKMDTILIPAYSFNFLQSADQPGFSASEGREYTDMMIFPNFLRQRNKRTLFQAPIVKVIQDQYTIVDHFKDYIILKKKSLVPSRETEVQPPKAVIPSLN